MPAALLHLQKRFKLTMHPDGQPQALVEVVDQERWVRCCPLCGCIHQLPDVDEAVPYAPLCQTQPILFKTQQTAWRKLYPDVAKCTTLHLVRRLE